MAWHGMAWPTAVEEAPEIVRNHQAHSQAVELAGRVALKTKTFGGNGDKEMGCGHGGVVACVRSKYAIIYST